MRNKTILKLVLSVICIYGFVFLLLRLGHNSGLFYEDETNQVIQLYTHMYNAFKEGTLSFWDSNVGLGASTFVHFWTVLGSPSFYLFLLLPKAEYIPSFIIVVNLLRSIVLSLLGYHYCKKYLSLQEHLCFIGGLLFAFNSFGIYFAHYPYFADFMIYTLLLMIACEKAFDHHFMPLILTICFASISNLYNVYMNCFFLLVYFHIRLFTKFHVTKKEYFAWFLKFLGAVLLGLGMSGIILIPNIRSLFSNNRVGNTDLPPFKSIKDIYALMTGLISPITNDYDYNIYVNYFSDGVVSPFPFIYSSILFIYSFVLTFKKDFAGKRPIFISFLVLMILMVSPYTNVLLNGNNSVRYGYFVAFISILYLLHAFSKSYEKKEYIQALIITCSILILCGSISIFFHVTSDLNKRNVFVNTVILIVLVSSSTYALIHDKKKMVCFSIFLEMAYCLISRYFNNFHFMSESNENWANYSEILYNTQALDTIQENDGTNDFYRIEQVRHDFTNRNDSLMHSYDGYNVYLSVYNFYTLPYSLKHFSSTQFIDTNGSKYIVKELSGLRYAAVYYDEFVSDDAKLIEENDLYRLYRYDNKIGLGYSMHSSIGQNEIDDLPVFLQDELMQRYVILDDSEGTYDHSYLPKEVTLEDNKLLLDETMRYIVVDYSTVQNNSSVTFDFYDAEGNNVAFIERSEYAYTIVQVPENASEVYIYARNLDNLNEYLDANIYTLNDTKLDASYISTVFTDGSKGKDSYTGTIEITTPGDFVVTSIAYDPNWKVYANGNEVSTFRVNNAFVGFQLNKGTYEIEMKYDPIHIIDIAISCISIVLAIGYCKKLKQVQDTSTFAKINMR